MTAPIRAMSSNSKADNAAENRITKTPLKFERVFLFMREKVSVTFL